MFRIPKISILSDFVIKGAKPTLLTAPDELNGQFLFTEHLVKEKVADTPDATQTGPEHHPVSSFDKQILDQVSEPVAANSEASGTGMFYLPGVSTEMVITLARMAQAAYRSNEDIVQLASLKSDSWSILGQRDLQPAANTGIWNGDYFENYSSNTFGGAAIVAKNGSQLVLSFRGTDEDLDWLNYPDILSPSGTYLRTGFEALLDAIAAYCRKSENGITDVYVTGHSLGGAAANQLRQQSTSISNSFFQTAKFVAFASPTISASRDILNIGFENDAVFKKQGLPGGDRGSSNSTDNFIWDSISYRLGAVSAGTDQNGPHSMSNYVRAVRTVIANASYLTTSQDSTVIVRPSNAAGITTLHSNISERWIEMQGALMLGVEPSTSDQNFLGTSFGDMIYGGSFSDRIDGLGGDDELFGGSGIDTIKGGSGNDTIFSLGDLDQIDGGEGIDSVDMISRAEGRTYNLRDGISNLSLSSSVTLRSNIENIEIFIGSDVADVYNVFDISSTFGQIRLNGLGGSDSYQFSTILNATTVIADDGLADTISVGGSRLSGEALQNSAGSNVYSLLGRDIQKLSSNSLSIFLGNRPIIIENWSQGDYGITLRPFGAPPPPPPTPGGGGSGGNAINPGFGRAIDGFDQAGRPMGDPLVFDLDGDGVELSSGVDQPILFDIDGDGFLERTGWVEADDGFLVRDENNNGRIDNVWEMFGDPTQLGFDELRTLDTSTNQFGLFGPVVDKEDAAWGTLRIWRDVNQNGITDASELTTLEDAGIASLSLTARSVNQVSNGNLIFEEADFFGADGVRFSSLSEVFFGFQEVGGPEILNPNQVAATGTFNLPESRGYGNLWSWSRKAAVDGEFRTALTAISNLQIGQLGQADGLAEKLLFAWADAEAINPSSRGSTFDARRLAVLEAAMGRGFVDATGSLRPDARTAPFLQTAWNELVSLVSDRVVMQSAFKSVFGSTNYDFSKDQVTFTATYTTIETRLLAMNEADRATALAQVETILEGNERLLGLAPGEASLRLGRLNATVQSDTQIFATALRSFSNIARTDITYPSFNGWVQLQDVSVPSGDRVVVGTGQNDRVFAMTTNRLLFWGGAGNDAVSHLGSGSTIILGDGNDSYGPFTAGVFSQVKETKVYGGAGNDGLSLWGSADSQAYGGVGDDRITISGAASAPRPGQSAQAISERNTAYGGLGNDSITLTGFRNIAFGEGGDDVIDVGGFSENFFLRADGGDGNDRIIGQTGGNSRGANQATIQAGAGNDTVSGTFFHSSLDLGTGNDVANLTLIDTSTSIEGSLVLGGLGDDAITLDQAGRGFANQILARTRIDAGDGNDIVTILGDSGSFNRTPVIVDSSAGVDRLILRGRAVLKVSVAQNDVETVEFEAQGGSNNTGGYGLILDLQAFSQYRSLEELNIQKSEGLWTIVLPNSQRIELKRAAINSFTDIVGVFADGIARGSNGSDSWVGTYGKETYFGGDGDDIARGDQGDDALNGEGGFDQLFGEWGNDTLNGGEGNDSLDGGLGSDLLNGGNGSDRLTAGLEDILDGGDGIDTAVIDFRQVSGPLYLDLSALWGGGVGRFGTTQAMTGRLIAIEKFEVQASAQSDFVDFGANAQDAMTLDLGAGNDTVKGGAGADFFWGGNGNDLIEGGSGADRLGHTGWFFGPGTADEAGNDTLSGGDGNDSLGGGLGDDLLNGDAGNDWLQGGAGNDILRAGSGSDELEGGLGADVLDGGAGFDVATYINSTTGLTLFMAGGTFNSGEANGDTHTSIEGLIGSQFADIVGGDGLSNELHGINGNDWLYGQGGDDRLIGGNGNDVLSGGLGADRLEGGADIDVAFYRDATAAVSGNLLTGGTAGEAAGDSYLDVENIWGSRFDDVLVGNNGAGQVYGFEGNDNLSGLDGDDFFYGGQGFDTLTGGAGVDNFFLLSWRDQVNAFGTPEPFEGGDTYTDFTSGTDRIILSRFWFGFGNIQGPAAALTETHANFVTNGAAATSRPSLIWNTSNRTLLFDPDGTGSTQSVVIGTFQQGVTLALSDIWTA